MLVPRN